jgi:hypothetical protein
MSLGASYELDVTGDINFSGNLRKGGVIQEIQAPLKKYSEDPDQASLLFGVDGSEASRLFTTSIGVSIDGALQMFNHTGAPTAPPTSTYVNFFFDGELPYYQANGGSVTPMSTPWTAHTSPTRIAYANEVVIGSTTAPAVSTSILGLNGNLEIYDQAAGAGINLIDSTYSDFFVGLDVNGDFRISEGITNRMSYDISEAHWNILGKASVTNSLHVGGSAAPAYELQVTGSGEMVSLEVSAANSGFMRWRKDGASHFYIGKGTGGSDTISISNSLGDIYFSSNGSNMRLNSNGLGVGTSADSSYALKVSGRIYSDEGLTVVNSTAGTTHLPHTDGNAYLTYKSDKTFTIRTYNGSMELSKLQII